MAATRNDEFELPDSSYSVLDIQDYIEYIIKNHEILTIGLPIYVYIYRTNNRLVFKVKDRYKSQVVQCSKLQTVRNRGQLAYCLNILLINK